MRQLFWYALQLSVFGGIVYLLFDFPAETGHSAGIVIVLAAFFAWLASTLVSLCFEGLAWLVQRGQRQ